MEAHLFEGIFFVCLFMFEDEKAELHLKIAEGLQCWAGVEAYVSIGMSTPPNVWFKMWEIHYFMVQWLEIFLSKSGSFKKQGSLQHAL